MTPAKAARPPVKMESLRIIDFSSESEDLSCRPQRVDIRHSLRKEHAADSPVDAAQFAAESMHDTNELLSR
jgi:hypothetical protein